MNGASIQDQQGKSKPGICPEVIACSSYKSKEVFNSIQRVIAPKHGGADPVDFTGLDFEHLRIFTS
jgi:hypothetical protein